MSSIGERKKRRRTCLKRVELLDPKEERMLKIAIANSKIEVQRRQVVVPSACIFRPTLEEFRDPLRYIASIHQQVEHDGICKIIPPSGWDPPFLCDFQSKKEFSTKLQQVDALQEGKYYGEGKKYTLQSYQEMANEFQSNWLKSKGIVPESFNGEKAEEAYWNIVQSSTEQVHVEYGNDLHTSIHGSGFPVHASNEKMFKNFLASCNEIPDFQDENYYKKCGWNINNLPQWPGSILRHIRTPINGVNLPWLYLGMLFTSFCWHTEDNYLYSINYMHKGAPKTWYGVPSADAQLFEKVMRNKVPLRFRQNPDLLFHLVTMLSPTTLIDNKVKVTKLEQQPGEFVITFPNAYHAGFNQGFNFAEAVNFAMPDWISFGRQCSEKYRSFGRSSVFSHDRLICTLSQSMLEHNKESCQLLRAELEELLAEEVYMREMLRTAGIFQAVEMPKNETSCNIDEQTMKEDDKRQCIVCKHTCYVSGIICKCNSTAISCLRHYKDMCKCPTESKCFLLWMDISDLELLIEQVNQQEILCKMKNENNLLQQNNISNNNNNNTWISNSCGSPQIEDIQSVQYVD